MLVKEKMRNHWFWKAFMHKSLVLSVKKQKGSKFESIDKTTRHFTREVKLNRRSFNFKAPAAFIACMFSLCRCRGTCLRGLWTLRLLLKSQQWEGPWPGFWAPSLRKREKKMARSLLGSLRNQGSLQIWPQHNSQIYLEHTPPQRQPVRVTTGVYFNSVAETVCL